MSKTKAQSKEIAFLKQLVEYGLPEGLRAVTELGAAGRRDAKKNPAAFAKKAGVQIPAGLTIALESQGSAPASREKMCWWVCLGGIFGQTCVKICGWDDRNSPI